MRDTAAAKELANKPQTEPLDRRDRLLLSRLRGVHLVVPPSVIEILARLFAEFAPPLVFNRWGDFATWSAAYLNHITVINPKPLIAADSDNITDP
jgi:hypothetical protein